MSELPGHPLLERGIPEPAPWLPLRSPLPYPRASYPRASYPVTLPAACYRAGAGFMVHVKPGCRCSR